jgi:hypothetical protein
MRTREPSAPTKNHEYRPKHAAESRAAVTAMRVVADASAKMGNRTAAVEAARRGASVDGKDRVSMRTGKTKPNSLRLARSLRI